MTATPLLRVSNLSVHFDRAARPAVDDVSFEVAAGECLAIVGESGSGKSVTARSLLGLAPAGAHVSFSELSLAGESLPAPGARRWRTIRGASIGLVLQDALVSLDPLRPVGREIDDVLRLHTTLSQRERQARVLELLDAVGIPDPALRARQRSGELSGGLRQRALIAAGIAAGPALIIADEPTTALDVTVQARVLELLSSLRNNGTAMILITHDLAVVSRVADRVAVMSEGRIVETGETKGLLRAPATVPTQQLLAAIPVDVPRAIPLTLPSDAEAVTLPNTSASARAAATATAAASSVPALELRGVSRRYPTPHGAAIQALDNVSLTLASGTTLGLVGQSGSGKTTIARIALGLETADSGEVLLAGQEWGSLSARERRPLRPTLGAIYQDALSSFDPRLSVERILTDALSAGASANHQSLTTPDELLDAVGLPRAVKNRRPLLLSGGQRQRVAIARALAPGPQTILCDEPVSSLDVSTQARVLNLLDELQRHLHLSYLFISHDLGVIRHMSDRVAVINEGRIVETGPTDEIFIAPQHPYTRSLIAALPRVRG
ncbi:ABC transporter ATP-binding protein [Salinibacterium sp. NSLL150]|uniref:nickel ABC transporter ATP-binding protein NikE n=1 Tax=unclassified Salinibacterium TaxID=2632331 RepID=UPI0018CCF239|nr:MULTISPECIES: ABC transporter ATP-binding protein [unclassified Salinibacterium]MBH0098842.1 ABC transporter ATP-binding protein [Salinibacterium sp. NSLL35]MBH0101597.1 ABC transporter ATP-binding protein [Salinibacterium sp. NSLL150]MBH0104356.1 ABC transporter ATP-binding protein [Salinibacterium sp. NSLL16]MBH0107117.1 ABC transporter ATP-binding protein [Salinibacterium sp. NSLL17]